MLGVANLCWFIVIALWFVNREKKGMKMLERRVLTVSCAHHGFYANTISNDTFRIFMKVSDPGPVTNVDSRFTRNQIWNGTS